MIRLPDFVVIGAARCATTSLYEYLRQHPQVFMSPEKETDYFSLGDLPQDEVPPGASRYRARTRAEYEAQFALAGDARAVGEASPTYLFYSRSADRMGRVIPDAKLICVLRDPVERAYSHWALARRSGFEPLADFEAGVAADGRVPDAHHRDVTREPAHHFRSWLSGPGRSGPARRTRRIIAARGSLTTSPPGTGGATSRRGAPSPARRPSPPGPARRRRRPRCS